MPYFLRRVEVDGFQTSRDISLTLHSDVNFIIGRNGTGKTTFIRIMSAALGLDLKELSTLPFQRLSITFYDLEQNRSPTLKIERDRDRNTYLSVYFRESGTDRFEQYIGEDEEHSPDWRRLTSLLLQSSRDTERKREIEKKLPPLNALRQRIKQNLQYSWLPLLRSRTAPRRNELYLPEYSEEPINRKLKELLSLTSNYLSSIDSEVADATRTFQREAFVSYLEKNTLDSSVLDSIDLRDEQKQLTSMFVELGYPTGDLERKIESYFQRAKSTKDRLIKQPGSYLPDDLVSLVISSALHRIVSSYQVYVQSKKSITQPKVEFIRILNDMIYRKLLSFDNSNRLVVEDVSGGRPGKNLDVFELSSGEKQLLVILLEALLQKQQTYVFLADEPELSLHVDWQEQLVKIILEMNKKSQIIFATHSPDIVSVFQNRVFDFEKI